MFHDRMIIEYEITKARALKIECSLFIITPICANGRMCKFTYNDILHYIKLLYLSKMFEILHICFKKGCHST